MRRLAVLAALLLASLTSVAWTDVQGTASQQTLPYSGYAELFWMGQGRYVNCPQGVEIEWVALNNLVGWAPEIPGCRIEIDPVWWRALARSQRCRLLLHEYGHLVGLQHVANYRRIMYPNTHYSYPACRRFDRY